jgi:acyl carrier protein
VSAPDDLTSGPQTGSPPDLPAQLLALSAQQLEVAPAALLPDALLGDDLGIDSLSAIEWGMSIEDAFGISLPDDAWGYVRTYGMVEELVTRLSRRSVRS